MKLPYNWEIDAILIKKSPIAYAELKQRSHNSYDFPSVIISEHKTMTAFQYVTHLARMDGQTIPFIYFVRFLDRDMFCKIDREVFGNFERKCLSAKNHLDDPRDREWVRYIPFNLFNSEILVHITQFSFLQDCS